MSFLFLLLGLNTNSGATTSLSASSNTSFCLVESAQILADQLSRQQWNSLLKDELAATSAGHAADAPRAEAAKAVLTPILNLSFEQSLMQAMKDLGVAEANPDYIYYGFSHTGFAQLTPELRTGVAERALTTYLANQPNPLPKELHDFLAPYRIPSRVGRGQSGYDSLISRITQLLEGPAKPWLKSQSFSGIKAKASSNSDWTEEMSVLRNWEQIGPDALAEIKNKAWFKTLPPHTQSILVARHGVSAARNEIEVEILGIDRQLATIESDQPTLPKLSKEREKFSASLKAVLTSKALNEETFIFHVLPEVAMQLELWSQQAEGWDSGNFTREQQNQVDTIRNEVGLLLSEHAKNIKVDKQLISQAVRAYTEIVTRGRGWRSGVGKDNPLFWFASQMIAIMGTIVLTPEFNQVHPLAAVGLASIPTVFAGVFSLRKPIRAAWLKHATRSEIDKFSNALNNDPQILSHGELKTLSTERKRIFTDDLIAEREKLRARLELFSRLPASVEETKQPKQLNH